mmetsp:Transcript_36293/g.108476  ORF Transcript_36293/g.108476 Transcript_36293/m.108476 type:complete len:210 (+) Transcript_36293:595-1224(+)
MATGRSSSTMPGPTAATRTRPSPSRGPGSGPPTAWSGRPGRSGRRWRSSQRSARCRRRWSRSGCTCTAVRLRRRPALHGATWARRCRCWLAVHRVRVRRKATGSWLPRLVPQRHGSTSPPVALVQCSCCLRWGTPSASAAASGSFVSTGRRSRRPWSAWGAHWRWCPRARPAGPCPTTPCSTWPRSVPSSTRKERFRGARRMQAPSMGL